MKENKITTYLLYAIGEIILVVVGILIAVRIDDLNTYQNQREIEQKIVMEIKQDLMTCSLELQQNIEYQIRGFEWAKELYKRQKEGKCDSLAVFAIMLGSHDKQFYPKSSGYETLKAVGLNIILNDSLRRSITNLYELSFPKIVKRGYYENQLENPMILSRPITEKYIDLSSGRDFKVEMTDSLFYYQKIPQIINCEEFIKDPMVTKLSSALANIRGGNVYTFQKIHNEIKAIVEVIDQEYAKHN